MTNEKNRYKEVERIKLSFEKYVEFMQKSK